MDGITTNVYFSSTVRDILNELSTVLERSEISEIPQTLELIANMKTAEKLMAKIASDLKRFVFVPSSSKTEVIVRELPQIRVRSPIAFKGIRIRTSTFSRNAAIDVVDLSDSDYLKLNMN